MSRAHARCLHTVSHVDGPACRDMRNDVKEAYLRQQLKICIFLWKRLHGLGVADSVSSGCASIDCNEINDSTI